MKREKVPLSSTGSLRISVLLCSAVFFTVLSSGISHAVIPDISAEEAQLIAERIFKNECFVEKDCLIEWNEGEEFLSLGLGHFIWYPENILSVFEESFRAYLQYARDAGETSPVWLNKTPFPSCPWPLREQFLASKESALYQDLLDFVRKTKHRQAEYLVFKARKSFQEVIGAAPDDQRLRISRDILRLANDAQGLYVIVDYVNFKGTGILNFENYQGEGWGLLQVLQGMRDTKNFEETLVEFVRSAKEVLNRRVANAPVERREEKWLPGWLRRIDTYLVRGI